MPVVILNLFTKSFDSGSIFSAFPPRVKVLMLRQKESGVKVGGKPGHCLLDLVEIRLKNNCINTNL